MKIILITVLIFFSFLPSQGQSIIPLSVDESFNTNFWGLADSQSSVASIYCDSTGKITVSGEFYGDIGNIYDDNIRRLYENGEVDSSFQSNHSFMGNGLGGITKTNDSIYFTDASGYSLRCDSNGNFDFGYESNQLFCEFGGRNLLLQNSEVLHAGYLDPFPCGVGVKYEFSKLSQCGKLDSTFLQSLGTNFDHGATCVVLQSDNKIICAGRFDNLNGNYSPRICRINPDGSFDSSFYSIFSNESADTLNGLFYAIYNLFLDQDKILVTGHLKLQNDTGVFSFLRLNSNGTLDSGFNRINNVGIMNNSNGVYGNVNACLKMQDGGYILGGNFDKYQGIYRNCLVRTDSNGFINPDYFNGAGPDTAYVEVWNNSFAIPAPPEVITLAMDSFGSVYVGGRFHKFDGYIRNYIVRLHGLSVGINSPEPQRNILLAYPNPANYAINFILQSNTRGNAILQISDLAGRILQTEEIESGRRITLATSALSNGVYFAKAKTENGLIELTKFIVTH